MPAFSRLYSSIFFSTSGVVTCFSKDKASGHSLQGRARPREPGLPPPGPPVRPEPTRRRADPSTRTAASESRPRPRPRLETPL